MLVQGLVAKALFGASKTEQFDPVTGETTTAYRQPPQKDLDAILALAKQLRGEDQVPGLEKYLP